MRASRLSLVLALLALDLATVACSGGSPPGVIAVDDAPSVAKPGSAASFPPESWPDAGARDASLDAPSSTRRPFTAFDINHVLSTGQSLATGYGGAPSSLTQPYGNLMLAMGVATTRWFGDPFLPLVEGPNYETMSSAIANHVAERALIERSLSHVMLVSLHAGGGTPYSGVKKGTEFFQRGMDQVTGAKGRASLNGQSYVVRAVTSVHGESDNIEKNTHYEADIIEWQRDYETDVRAITGQTEPIPMLHTQNSAEAESTIPLAMLAAHVHAPGKVVLVGPKYHLPYSDGVHLSAEGTQHMGEDYAKVYRRVVIDGLDWEPLRPSSIVRSGNTITITFLVPSPPLAIDTTLVEEAPGKGFKYVDDSGDAPAVTNVQVLAPNTVRLTLSSAPTGPGRLRYAYWDQLGQVGPRGNLRDSDATPSRFGFKLYNWGVQFEEPVP